MSIDVTPPFSSETSPLTNDDFSGCGDEGASVVMDHREKPSGMDLLLTQIPNVNVRFETMETADYSIDGRLLVERKTVADFAQSIIDTRLFSQANRLSRSPCPALVILEGRGSEIADTGITRKAIQGALITLTLLFRLPVLRAVDKEETARLMVYAARQLRRAGNADYPLNHRKPKSANGQKIHLLRTLPGIGTDRAKKLLKTFGSVEKCLSASVDELATVEGIGVKTAERIRQVIE